MADSGPSSRRYGCPACGSGLRYDIASDGMKCDQCGSLTPIASLPAEEPQESMEVTEFHCPQCGAAVYSTDTEVTSFCTFCGSDVVLTGKLSRTKRPAKIVPFRVTREKCEGAYRDHLKKYLLAPADLKSAETFSHFRPVYVPFWSYQVSAEGPARLEGKKSYTKGNTQYDETYDLTMDAKIRQSGILYDASSAFEDETAAMLKHTAEDAVPFHPAYLSGFYAQGADVPGETYHSEAAASAVRKFMEKVKEENGMDSVEMKGDISENFGLPSARFREDLVMMPVWLLAHRQGARVVYTAVNGRSGEVVQDVPVSNGKVIGVILLLAAALFALLQMSVTLRPELLMSLCAVLGVITVYQFSGSQRRLWKRRTRAWEPHPEENREFVGPAQAMLKRGKNGISAKSGSGLSGGKNLVYIIGLLAVCLAYVAMRIPRLGSLLSGSSQRVITLAVMAVSLAVMVIHVIHRLKTKDSGASWPRLISCLACAAGLLFLVTGQVEDLVYYGCAAAMLLASVVELLISNRAHNEYASRPVPFFGETEVTE